MDNYIPPTLDWVREQVELYEGSGGTKGTTLRDTGLPCIIITHKGGQTGAMRKIPVMKVKHGNSYVLIGSYGGRPKNPVWDESGGRYGTLRHGFGGARGADGGV